jgi:hypothetical protein
VDKIGGVCDMQGEQKCIYSFDEEAWRKEHIGKTYDHQEIVAQDGDKWQAVVNMVINLQVS